MSEENVRKGLYDLTIREAMQLKHPIMMKDLFSVEVEGRNTTLNLSWYQVIELVNYLSKKETLTEDSTLTQAFTAAKDFL